MFISVFVVELLRGLSRKRVGSSVPRTKFVVIV